MDLYYVSVVLLISATTASYCEVMHYAYDPIQSLKHIPCHVVRSVVCTESLHVVVCCASLSTISLCSSTHHILLHLDQFLHLLLHPVSSEPLGTESGLTPL